MQVIRCREESGWDAITPRPAWCIGAAPLLSSVRTNGNASFLWLLPLVALAGVAAYVGWQVRSHRRSRGLDTVLEYAPARGSAGALACTPKLPAPIASLLP